MSRSGTGARGARTESLGSLQSSMSSTAPETGLSNAKEVQRKIHLSRRAAQEQEMREALELFKAKPPPPKMEVQKGCCLKWRRYYGCCYTRTLHEAVIAGDSKTIARTLDRANQADAKELRARPQERGVRGADDAGGTLFVGRAQRLANEFDANGRTPLSLAIKAERSDLVGLLLDLSSDPNKGEDGRHFPGTLTGATPSLHAILGELPLVVLTLARKHADLNAPNTFGMTPLMLALLAGDPDLAAMLLEQGADPEARDRAGWTPLHYAAYGGSLDCVKTLLATGVSHKKKDKAGYKAIDWAQWIRRKHSSYEHGLVECFLEDYKPTLALYA